MNRLSVLIQKEGCLNPFIAVRLLGKTVLKKVIRSYTDILPEKRVQACAYASRTVASFCVFAAPDIGCTIEFCKQIVEDFRLASAIVTHKFCVITEALLRLAS